MSFQSNAFQSNAFQMENVSASAGTGGWGARLNASVKPLSSRKRKHHEEDDRRRHSLEVLETAINEAIAKIEGHKDEAPAIVSEIVLAVPPIDWEAIETYRQVYLDTERRLESVLIELKAYELRLEEDDVEILLM